MKKRENLQTIGVQQQLSLWLIKKISCINEINESEIRMDIPLANYGLDSLHALAIAGELEEMLDIELPLTLLWEYPTIDKITMFIDNQLLNRIKKTA